MNIKSEETYTSKNISQLYNFPFRNFQEYKKAFSERLLLPSVTISFAIQWAENGINTPRFLKYQTKLFMKLPFFFHVYISCFGNYFFKLEISLNNSCFYCSLFNFSSQFQKFYCFI